MTLRPNLRPNFRHLWAALAATFLLASTPVCAQTQSGKPIRVILMYTAGSISDVIFRLATEKAGVALGQSFVMEHKPGAGGTLAADHVAKSAPDGTTLLFGATPLAINATLYKKLSYDAVRDFAPITLAASGPLVLFVASTLPVTTVTELIAYAKSRPRELNYASVGIGTGPHLTGVMFARAAGIELTHVPYKGIAQILPDMASGQIHLTFNAIGPTAQFVQTGRIRIVAVGGPKKLAQYPDIPSTADTLPGFDVRGWYGFFAPAATPREVLVRLNSELVKAIAAPETAERLAKVGLEPHAQSLDEAARFLASEVDKWGQAVKASGATAD